VKEWVIPTEGNGEFVANMERVPDTYKLPYDEDCPVVCMDESPKHGSWLNMAEIELHVLNGQCLNRHITSMDVIKKEANAWQNHRNNKDVKISWLFTNEQARIKLKRLYPSILN